MKYLQGMLTGCLMAMCFVLITGSEHHKPQEKKITKYKIVVSSPFRKGLMEKVEQHLEDGWRLRGDIVPYTGRVIEYMQIMVK